MVVGGTVDEWDDKNKIILTPVGLRQEILY